MPHIPAAGTGLPDLELSTVQRLALSRVNSLRFGVTRCGLSSPYLPKRMREAFQKRNAMHCGKLRSSEVKTDKQAELVLM